MNASSDLFAMRATFDFGVPLRIPGAESAPTYAIAETKTSERGTGLLHTPDADTDYAPELTERFQARAASR